jgi:hypothetical protein
MAQDWSKEAVAALPKYFPPLNSQPETVTSNIRYGRNNTVYVNACTPCYIGFVCPDFSR